MISLWVCVSTKTDVKDEGLPFLLSIRVKTEVSRKVVLRAGLESITDVGDPEFLSITGLWNGMKVSL